jgi:hypothetical protein
MASEPVPSLQVEPHHSLGLNLVGTVALPSPFPAEGRIYVVRHPAAPGAKGEDVKPTYHIKIVQKLSDSHSITRIVSLDHVRMIRFSQPGESVTKGTSPAGKAGPTPSELSLDDLKKEVTAVPWAKAVKDENHSYEVELQPHRTGVVYVPEAAPVLLRHECTVTAATSLESIVGTGAFCPHTSKFIACPHC